MRALATYVLSCLQDPRSGEVIEKELYVTRKGATPAAEGQMGLIPGSMGQPAPDLHVCASLQAFSSHWLLYKAAG